LQKCGIISNVVMSVILCVLMCKVCKMLSQMEMSQREISNPRIDCDLNLKNIKHCSSAVICCSFKKRGIGFHI